MYKGVTLFYVGDLYIRIWICFGLGSERLSEFKLTPNAKPDFRDHVAWHHHHVAEQPLHSI